MQRVLTDNGSGYRSHLFQHTCDMLGIRPRRTRPYRPCTNGKAERFIQTLQREWAYGQSYSTSGERTRALPRWLHFYNTRRLHGGIGHHAPLTRLQAAA